MGTDAERMVLVELAEDLGRFADELERGPSGWLVMPLLELATGRMTFSSSGQQERFRGALYALFYGLPAAASKRDILAEVRRVVEAMREALDGEPETG